MKIGLYFGSFNPVHVGHLIIANHMIDNSDLDQVWMVVSPQNPFKEKKSLLKDYHRLALVEIALEDNDKIKASDIEFKLKQPSYTIDTLVYLKEKHPKYQLSILMGEDNLRSFHKWKNYEQILKNHSIYIYPRVETIQEKNSAEKESTATQVAENENIIFCKEVPVMKISSSFIRKNIAAGKSIKYLVTEKVEKYIDEMNFYKT